MNEIINAESQNLQVKRNGEEVLVSNQQKIIDAEHSPSPKTPAPAKITYSISRNRICKMLLFCLSEAGTAAEFSALARGAQIAVAALPQFDEQDKLTFRELRAAIYDANFNADGGKA